MIPPRMADSTTPSLIPEVFRTRNNGVAVYANGPEAWGGRAAGHFPRKRFVTVEPVRETAHAADVAIIDVEQLDCQPADVPGWVEARRSRHGLSAQCIVYCDRSTVWQVAGAMRGAGLDPSTLLHWVATLDGLRWTPAALVAQLANPPADWGAQAVTVHPATIWGVQWLPHGDYDESVIWGPPYWSDAD